MADKTAEIPRQRSDGDEAKPRRVKTTVVCLIELDESIIRHRWRGETEAEIIASIQSESLDDQIQDFVDDVQATPAEKLTFLRTVKIVDPN